MIRDIYFFFFPALLFLLLVFLIPVSDTGQVASHHKTVGKVESKLFIVTSFAGTYLCFFIGCLQFPSISFLDL